jgi:hypothetical protein
MKNISILLILYFILTSLATGIQFPYAPLGDCYQGSIDLSKEYPTSIVQYAYYEPKSSSDPGHLVLLINGSLVDSYYGPTTEHYIGKPDKLFNTLEELNNYITIKIPKNIW